MTRWLARLLLLGGLVALVAPVILACQDMEPTPLTSDARGPVQDGAANAQDANGQAGDGGPAGDAMPPTDGGLDAGSDAGTDAGSDAGTDGAPVDAIVVEK